VLRACEDVEDALVARLRRRDEARALHDAEAALQRSRQASVDGYEAGTLSLLDVTDADRQLLVIQDRAAQADADAARAAVALARAVGG
jgi:outer membrane protein TolC